MNDEEQTNLPPYFITKGPTVFVAVLCMISGQIIGVFHCSPIQG